MTEEPEAAPVAILPNPYEEILRAGGDVVQDDVEASTFRALLAHGRSIRDTIAWGRRQIHSPSQDWRGLCLSFVRQAYGLPAVYPSAISAWEHARRRVPVSNPERIPRGVPVFYRGGTYGHVVLSLGDGWCLSTDVKRRGQVDRVRLAAITSAWGMPILGWTRDLNSTTLPVPRRPAPRRPNVEAALQAIARAKGATGRRRRAIHKALDHAAQDLRTIPRRK